MLPRPASSRKAKPQLASILATAQESLGLKAVNGPDTPLGNKMDMGSIYEKATQNVSNRFEKLQFGIPSSTTIAFIVSCLLWYMSSALSSNTSKALLSSPKKLSPRPPAPFPYPVTLTMLQFFFVHLLSAAVASPVITSFIPGMRKPVTRIVKNIGRARMLDMARLSAFNVVGHALSTVAISRVPVSTVHTIKALTPLFTVMSFHFIFHIHYSFMTYLSLLPLTLGVMMACTSLSFSVNDLVGLSTALASTLIFVAQSIYSKNLIGRSEGAGKQEKEGKLDKVNILYYSSACSVVLMIPMALYYDGSALFYNTRTAVSSTSSAQFESIALAGASASILYIFFMIVANGISQFFQTFLAFSVLNLVSPVTYSIASLFKRVFVICFAIIWFGQSVSRLQWAGIILTFFGLYLYNDSKASKSIQKGEEKLRQEEKDKELSLPTSISEKSSSTYDSQNWSSTSATATGRPIIVNTSNVPITAIGSGYRNVSSQVEINPPTNSRRMASLNRDAFYKDPRSALPSPPPSRGSTSDEEDEKSANRHR